MKQGKKCPENKSKVSAVCQNIFQSLNVISFARKNKEVLLLCQQDKFLRGGGGGCRHQQAHWAVAGQQAGLDRQHKAVQEGSKQAVPSEEAAML